MRDAGRLVEERDGYRLYECYVDGTFSKARGGGDGVGVTKAGKGVKIMVLYSTHPGYAKQMAEALRKCKPSCMPERVKLRIP